MKSSIEFDCMDFEKVVFGWQHFLKYFDLGKPLQVTAYSDPEYPKICLLFLEPDGSGRMKGKARGSVHREDCERFFAFCGWDIFKKYEHGKKQRIIVNYDPQNKAVSIEVHKDLCGWKEFEEMSSKYFPYYPT